MAKVFRTRYKSYRVIIFLVVVDILILWFAWDSRNYWLLLSLLAPLLLWFDHVFSRIIIRENGDVWIRRGFTGVNRMYGISELVYRTQAWESQQIVLHHTKGYTTIDPADKKAFIAAMKEINPMMTYREE